MAYDSVFGDVKAPRESDEFRKDAARWIGSHGKTTLGQMLTESRPAVEMTDEAFAPVADSWQYTSTATAMVTSDFRARFGRPRSVRDEISLELRM
ncbi:hypothetical protein [Aurantimonas endophytica]|uniref:Uncharacterized protein n=1 Tax=Aurantimonas endophytica TaxID=1522175 RepID=A0A7W6HHA2_9HYPH|nr:hypothetical protein [Aurantimonas endophytica]MBB4005169.1 hypothetical protein [Aurantimonas endophytica]MCO6406168.1 hypothetical protein [Aurantimonas endophytica]